MTHLLVVVLNDLSHLPKLMKAWRKIGVPGVLILPSLEGFRVENWIKKLGSGSIGWMLDPGIYGQRTLLGLIEGEDLLEQAIAEADRLVGGFDSPHSGLLFSLPVGRTLGLKHWSQIPGHAQKPNMDETLRPEKNTLNRTSQVADVLNILRISPAIVPTGATLAEVMDQLVSHPNVQVVCVVNEQERLVGLIDMINISNALLLAVFPEEFLGDLKGLETVLDPADRPAFRTAGEIMAEPACLQQKDSLQAALHNLHQRKLPGLPVVDDQSHIVGYVNLLELLMVCLRSGSKLGSQGKAGKRTG
jgi:CBS domain-containing protein